MGCKCDPAERWTVAVLVWWAIQKHKEFFLHIKKKSCMSYFNLCNRSWCFCLLNLEGIVSVVFWCCLYPRKLPWWWLNASPVLLLSHLTVGLLRFFFLLFQQILEEKYSLNAHLRKSTERAFLYVFHYSGKQLQIIWVYLWWSIAEVRIWEKKKNKKERHEIFPVLATIAKQLQIRLIMKEEDRLIFCTIQLDLRVNNHKMHLLSASLV